MATYDKCSSDHFSSVIKWMQQVFHPSAVAEVVAAAAVLAAAVVVAAAPAWHEGTRVGACIAASFFPCPLQGQLRKLVVVQYRALVAGQLGWAVPT